MATSVLGSVICYDVVGNSVSPSHDFGNHTCGCMVPITVTSNDGQLVQDFQIPAYWGQTNAPFTTADVQNTIASLQNQVETQQALNVSQAATPPTAWY